MLRSPELITCSQLEREAQILAMETQKDQAKAGPLKVISAALVELLRQNPTQSVTQSFPYNDQNYELAIEIGAITDVSTSPIKRVAIRSLAPLRQTQTAQFLGTSRIRFQPGEVLYRIPEVAFSETKHQLFLSVFVATSKDCPPGFAKSMALLGHQLNRFLLELLPSPLKENQAIGVIIDGAKARGGQGALTNWSAEMAHRLGYSPDLQIEGRYFYEYERVENSAKRDSTAVHPGR